MNVLLVEDDKTLAMAMGIRLKAYGIKVHNSTDAISAISAAVNFKPDLALIDINLPGGDGFVVAERLLLNQSTSSIPFAFITASKKSGLRQKASELGAMGFLEKPFEASELIGLLDSVNL